MRKILQILLPLATIGSCSGSLIGAYYTRAYYCGWRETNMVPPNVVVIPSPASIWPAIICGIFTIVCLVGMVILVLYGKEKWRWSRRRHKSIEKNIDIRSVGNIAKEPFLQWLHLEVEPSATLKVAQDARATMKVEIDQRIQGRPNPTVYSMRWASDEGPKEERTLRYGQPGLIPLILRSSIDIGISGYGESPHTPVKCNICYITEEQFLIHQNPIHQLPEAGKHRLTISVFYGDHNESISKVFELGVNHPGSSSNLIYIIPEEQKIEN